MSRREIRDVAASTRQRLLNEARSTGRPFQELLQYFAMERLPYRLSRSRHSGRFVLKGALMLTVWDVAPTRPTRDIDLLGFAPNEVTAIEAVFRDICRQEVEPDGMEFDPARVVGDRIAEEAEYSGVRIRFPGVLGTARVSMQVDVGFGDIIVPGATNVTYPAILDLPEPRILGYSLESLVAEKFHTMVLRGAFNSRLRDIHDVWTLSRQFEFAGPLLASAIRETFARRSTPVAPTAAALSSAFAELPGKTAQWTGFLRKGRLEDVPENLHAVIRGLAETSALSQLRSRAARSSATGGYPPAPGARVEPRAPAGRSLTGRFVIRKRAPVRVASVQPPVNSAQTRCATTT